MVTQDKRRRTDGRTARILHVPLTDEEYQQLRRLAFDTGGTMGDFASVGTRHVLTKNAHLLKGAKP